METNKNKEDKISRKHFLQICGSLIAGGSILGLSGLLLHKRYATTEGFSDGKSILDGNVTNIREKMPASPYRLVSAFRVPDTIEAFETAGENLIVAASNNIYVYDRLGGLVNNFAVGSQLRDMVTDNGKIYLLFPTRVEVYSQTGEWLHDWEACSDQSDYCSMAITPEAVFVTDAAHKNICKYTTEGHFVKFIQSPDGFIIPSYSFGITYANNTIYCSNPGRHKVESYTTDGEYTGSFGKAGGSAGMFCGCCNPVHLTYTATGEIITSEKGNPRISCYGKNGEFRSILLDQQALGGGNTAYDIKVQEDKLFVAGKDVISTFRYDSALAAKTACSTCGVDCPLRKGITI